LPVLLLASCGHGMGFCFKVLHKQALIQSQLLLLKKHALAALLQG
jgi:hypothetical protein